MKLRILLTACILLFLISCKKETALDKYYNQEGNFSGSVYNALKSSGRFKNFIKGVDSTDLANQLKYTLVTVIAPTDDAFNEYLNDHDNYNSLSDISRSELEDLISHHIITWPHSPSSFQVDPEFFKRQTNMASTRSGMKYNPVDMDSIEVLKGVKYLHFYYKEMLDMYNATEDDYFTITGNTLSEKTGFNVYNIPVDSIVPCGNGWIYYVNKVVAPYKNLDEWLLNANEYSLFAKLYNRFSIFVDHDGLNTTPRVKRSRLFQNDRNYLPDAELDYETANDIRVTLNAGSGFTVIAPQNNPLQDFINTYFTDYPGFIEGLDTVDLTTLENVHKHTIIRNIISPYIFVDNTIYPSKLKSAEGINGKDGTKLSFNDAEITEYNLSSNGLSYGVNKFVIPRTFRTILKPATTTPDYMYFLASVVKAKIVSYLNRLEDVSYTLILPADSAYIKNNFLLQPRDDYAGDLNKIDDRDEVVFVESDSTGLPIGDALNTQILFDIVFNHLFIGDITPGAEKQYVLNALGNYVCIKQDSIWSGGNTEKRWQTGSSEKVNIVKSITGFENGKIYVVNDLIKAPQFSLAQMLNINPAYSRFKDLCESSGLLTVEGEFNIAGNYPTLFVPTNEVVDQFILDGKWPSDEEEQKAIIKYCLVDKSVFTTETINETVTTLSKDEEASTEFNSVYKTVELNGNPENLTIKGNNNDVFLNVIEGEESNTICTDGIIHLVDGFVN